MNNGPCEECGMIDLDPVCSYCRLEEMSNKIFGRLRRLRKENQELKQDAQELVEALKDIRKYSLGSKADTCDEALNKWKEKYNDPA